MDQDLLRVADRVLKALEAERLDYLTMTETSVRRILSIRPDVSASKALRALNVVRRKS